MSRCSTRVNRTVPPGDVGQERAPNGEIYNELRPFVGVEGIRYQITGLEGGTVFNVPGLENVADPEKTVTGLRRAEREQLLVRSSPSTASRSNA